MPVAELASVNGRIAPTRDSVVRLPDDGLYRGDGVFEVVRLYAGRAFALADHLDRLERSAAAIALPVERALVERELEALLAAHGGADAQLRLVLTRGGQRIMAVEELTARAPSVRLATVTYAPTIILDRVKSLSYAANMHATRIAQSRGADEALLVTPQGSVLEPPTAAIFWAVDGILHTPSLDNAILDSITRARILDVLPAEQGEYERAALAGATEAFLASTTREVQPVAAIDDHELRWPGPRTAEAAEAFAAIVREELG